jgi:hypothetical protein
MARIKIDSSGSVKKTRIGECEVLDTQLQMYPSGKFFIQYLYKDLLEKLAEDMHRNVRADYDNVVMIEGGEGSGKSNLAYQVIKAYNPDFDIKQTYVYNMDGIRERFAAEDYGGDTFWMDETSQIASNRNWQSEDNKDLVSILEVCRSKHFTLVGCIPSISRADIYLREFRMRYKLRCVAMKFPTIGYKPRGIFELEKRDNETGKMKHMGYGLFDPMPDDQKQIYEPIKADFQEKFRLKISEKKEKGGYKEKYQQVQNEKTDIMAKLHDRGLVSDDDLMELFGYDQKKTFQNALSRARNRA